MRMHEVPNPISAKKLITATVVAVVVAVFLLVGVVLPAEYGVDLVGTGSILGLLGLAQERPIALEPDEYLVDTVELIVGPDDWLEYTYRFEEGGSMLFSWKATGLLSYNFHSAPAGAPPGYAESFDAQENDHAHGAYAAPYAGVHGWYWENKAETPVTITLSTAGFYSEAHEARDRVDGYHSLTDLRGNKVPAR